MHSLPSQYHLILTFLFRENGDSNLGNFWNKFLSEQKRYSVKQHQIFNLIANYCKFRECLLACFRSKRKTKKKLIDSKRSSKKPLLAFKITIIMMNSDFSIFWSGKFGLTKTLNQPIKEMDVMVFFLFIANHQNANDMKNFSYDCMSLCCVFAYVFRRASEF